MTPETHQAVFDRALGRCEAGIPGCTIYADHVHHALTAARGGKLLDPYTIEHLKAVCATCHTKIHGDGRWADFAYANRLLIRGGVLTGLDGRPVYAGPDAGLSIRHGSAS
jgi:hypothetical protein